MTLLFLSVVQVALGQAPAPPLEPEHAANAVYQGLRGSGLSIGGTKVPLPAPILSDGMPADAQLAAFKRIAESTEGANELLRDSVSAPFKLKIRNVEAKGGTVRVVDLWFVVHGSLDELNQDDLSGQAPKAGATEVGNMRFEGKALSETEISKRKLPPVGKDDRYVHSSALLLERIHVETSNRAVLSRSKESVVAALRTVPAFDVDPEFPNRWWPVTRKGNREEAGAAKLYAGGCSYAKVSRLAFRPGALLVEVHAAFDEPRAWFDGAPILRSKISLIAQDQVRHLRREIVKRRKSRAPAAPKA